MPKSLKKIMPWVILILVLYFIVRNPTGAASGGHRLVADLGAIGDGLGRFVTSLFTGR